MEAAVTLGGQHNQSSQEACDDAHHFKLQALEAGEEKKSQASQPGCEHGGSKSEATLNKGPTEKGPTEKDPTEKDPTCPPTQRAATSRQIHHRAVSSRPSMHAIFCAKPVLPWYILANSQNRQNGWPQATSVHVERGIRIRIRCPMAAREFRCAIGSQG